MTVRLTVRRQPWLAHVHQVAAAFGSGLVPVIKGNGYGFGRTTLHEVMRSLQPDPADRSSPAYVAVGSIHELHDVPPTVIPIVLTPTLAAPVDETPILTVSNLAHVHALAGWRGRVVVKLASSMRRYGVEPSGLAALTEAVADAGLEVEGLAIHLPLAGTDEARVGELRAWLPHLSARLPVWVSHLGPATYRAMCAEHPQFEWRIRIGTALWHGTPRGDFLHLSTEVLHTQPVHIGDVAGYHASVVPFDGTLVAVGAGLATGVAQLDDCDEQRRSPFHFERTRLQLLERPHLHSSMLVVPRGRPCPQVGDRVDVQRPLISTNVDEIEWR